MSRCSPVSLLFFNLFISLSLFSPVHLFTYGGGASRQEGWGRRRKGGDAEDAPRTSLRRDAARLVCLL